MKPLVLAVFTLIGVLLIGPAQAAPSSGGLSPCDPAKPDGPFCPPGSQVVPGPPCWPYGVGCPEQPISTAADDPAPPRAAGPFVPTSNRVDPNDPCPVPMSCAAYRQLDFPRPHPAQPCGVPTPSGDLRPAINVSLTIRHGEQGTNPVVWSFRLRNRTPSDLQLTFTSGQQMEVVLRRRGLDYFRWSWNRAFLQGQTYLTLGANEVRDLTAPSPDFRVRPGKYVLIACLRTIARTPIIARQVVVGQDGSARLLATRSAAKR